MVKPRQTVMYCHKIKDEKLPAGFRYYHFAMHPKITALYDSAENPVFKVLVKEIKEEKDSYWGWWDNSKKQFNFVYYAKSLVEMCFPYGSKIKEKHGKGHVLPVSIEVLEDKVKS